MSGIFGIFYLDGRPADPVDLGKMADILAHRGPDGAEVWSAGSVGLGHRMLWTTPESLHETLPLVASNGQFVLTADARIDNRTDLLPVLGLNDRPAGDVTDSDLILAAYQKWGEACPNKLIGDFAFAIWDGRKQQLFCARDPMGVKPFYYYYGNNVFVFASEIKALLCLPDVPRRLNEVRVADHLTYVFDDQRITFYQDIWRLPAAHTYAVGCFKACARRYWSLQTPPELRLSSNEEYAEAFREVFVEAVRCRLRTAYPVGSALSGGLDSSSIACVARDLQKKDNKTLHTFSAIFPGLPRKDRQWIDERRYIEAVVKQGSVEPHYIRADLLSPLTEQERVLWHLDGPDFAPNLYLHWALYTAAQRQRVRVFLDGENGDTTVSHGYEYLAQLACSGRWLLLYSEATALARKYNLKPRKAMWDLGFRPLIPETIMNIARRLLRRSVVQGLESSVINLDFATRIGLLERIRTFDRMREEGTPCNARDIHRRAIPSGLLFYALELADKAASAFAIEPRYPFLDQRLIEVSVAMPPGQKLHQGWDRMIMRRVMDGILPPEVQWRSFKANLGSNFKRKLLEYDGHNIEEIIGTEIERLQAYVDLSKFKSAYQRYISNPIESERESEIVYMVTMLAIWLRKVNKIKEDGVSW